MLILHDVLYRKKRMNFDNCLVSLHTIALCYPQVVCSRNETMIHDRYNTHDNICYTQIPYQIEDLLL